MASLETYLKENADAGLVSQIALDNAVDLFALPAAEVELRCLRSGLLPTRYQRNGQTIDLQQQLTLHTSRVVVIGCGGLGGHIIESLARVGIGHIRAIDPDRFEEHNLNRQILSSTSTIGLPKVQVAAQRVKEINPAISLQPVEEAFSAANSNLLMDADVVVDAIDTIPTRLLLAEQCRLLKMPLVHGAIGGWYGHVCTIFPGDEALELIYADQSGDRGVEQNLGNPAFTPAVVASIQSAEVVKVLLGKRTSLHNRQLIIDLLDMEFTEIPLTQSH